jgi:galactonate dehydratase
MLGGRRRATVPAYVSGLPEATRSARAALAQAWQAKGFEAFKFASPVADDGVAAEMETLRAALGSQARIACDLHWAQPAHEAAALIRAMEPHGLWFAEAPVRTEDIAGLAQLGRSVSAAIAVGEEWRTVHDMVPRLAAARIDIVQPEMGHKGVTEFMRIGALAHAHHLTVIPHATIGAGIFLAASLQCSAALPGVAAHEFQHSIFEPNRRLIEGGMDCAAGAYRLPEGPGLGVVPSPEALRLMQRA